MRQREREREGKRERERERERDEGEVRSIRREQERAMLGMRQKEFSERDAVIDREVMVNVYQSEKQANNINMHNFAGR